MNDWQNSRARIFGVLILAAGVLSAIAPTTPVAAQRHADDRVPNGEIGFELGMHTGEKLFGTRATWLVPRIYGHYRVARQFELGWDWAVIGTPIEDLDDRFLVGNPYFSGHYLIQLDQTRISLGGGIALPAARFGDDPGDVAVESAIYFGATGMNGGMRGWQFAPEDLSLVASARIDARPSPKFRLFGNVEGYFLIPTGDGDNETDFAMQFQFGAMVPVGDVEFGGRVNVFWIPSVDGDNAQLSLEPMFRYNGRGWHFNARFVANMDNPYGFAFDDGKFWGLFAGVSIDL